MPDAANRQLRIRTAYGGGPSRQFPSAPRRTHSLRMPSYVQSSISTCGDWMTLPDQRPFRNAQPLITVPTPNWRGSYW